MRRLGYTTVEDRVAFRPVPSRKPSVIATPGTTCKPDPRKRGARGPHMIIAPADDSELRAVHAWLMEPSRQVTEKLTNAVDDAVRHVLDGARTRRFDLMSPEVDGDERSTVGTKLQYYVLDELELPKVAPLDTVILDVAVELKTTTRTAVMVPPEGQCEVTLMIRVDAGQHRFAAWLMRTHRAWLGGGDVTKQRDGKRSPFAEAVRLYAMPVVPWTPLPPEPLRLLKPEQVAVVLPRKRSGVQAPGLVSRLTALFGYLPEVVVPRKSILTVGAGLDDPMRRARQTKERALAEHGLIVLVGKWRYQRDLAARLGLDISRAAWVAVTPERFISHGEPVPTLAELAELSEDHGEADDDSVGQL